MLLRVIYRHRSLPRYTTRRFCSPLQVSETVFESAAHDELQSIGDRADSHLEFLGADSVEVHDGVLSIEFPRGVFVINKHAASRQIWYSSPVSQPAYFDAFMDSGRKWWSTRLKTDLRTKLAEDIHTLTGKRLEY